MYLNLLKSKKGITFVKVLYVIFTIALFSHFFAPKIVTLTKRMEIKYAQKVLLDTYKSVELLNVEFQNPPRYSYTDLRDNSEYTKKLLKTLNIKPYNKDNNSGEKLIIDNRKNNIIIWYQLKNYERIKIVDGELDETVYTPENPLSDYGHKWLYKAKR